MNTLFCSQSRTGIRHRSTEPRGGAQGRGPFPFHSSQASLRSPPSKGFPAGGFPGPPGRLQARGQAPPLQGRSQTPPFPGPIRKSSPKTAGRAWGPSDRHPPNRRRQRSTALWRRRRHRRGSASRQHKDRPHRQFGRSTRRTPLPSHAGQASVRHLLGSRRIKPRPLHSVHLTAVGRSSVFSMARKSPWMIAMASWSAQRV
jgi:hypothetical protein